MHIASLCVVGGSQGGSCTDVGRDRSSNSGAGSGNNVCSSC